MVAVRRIRPDDGPLLRVARLEALTDSPSAFSSTLERELAFSDEDWRRRAAAGASGIDSATWLAFDGDALVGIVGAYRPDAAFPAVDLVSMWVAPSARRSGAGRLLVDTVISWARDSAASTLWLGVTRANEPARRLYEAMGFIATGDFQPLPSDPCKDEIRMRLTL